MSERVYGWLLRLYPASFRETYGDAAVQLFRDRARDEIGFFTKLRLWLDVLADLAISVPREYRRPSALVLIAAQQSLKRRPGFHLLERDVPSPGALISGGLLSLMALATFWISISRVEIYRPLRSTRNPLLLADGSRLPTPETLQLKPRDAISAPIEGVQIDAAERHRVLDRVIADLKRYYFERDIAQKTADALRMHVQRGDDNAAMEGAAFAGLMTRQMRDASHDMHLIVEYSRDRLPEHPPVQTPEAMERYREFVEQNNCFFKKIKILPHNIGYLKLDFFPDTSLCRSSATNAMASLNHVDAIIFDLRANTGGFPDMVSLIASYLFDHPEYMYSPRGAPTEASWTRSPVPGNKLADKPVYVLTSSTTWSGAEQFSYDLKMLNRATLVGETTRGGAHAGVFHRIDDHFGIGIPEEKAINPFAKTDWEGIGVEPDVKVKAADALGTAETLAERKLQKK